MRNSDAFTHLNRCGVGWERGRDSAVHNKLVVIGQRRRGLVLLLQLLQVVVRRVLLLLLLLLLLTVLQRDVELVGLGHGRGVELVERVLQNTCGKKTQLIDLFPQH